MKMKTKTVLVLGALLLAAPLLAMTDDKGIRQQFRAALERTRAAQASPPPDSEALRRYVLYPYLQATRIQSLLSRGAPGAADAAAAAWLSAYPDLPVSGELRRQWLVDLAARNAWPQLLANDDPRDADPNLVCMRWQARIATATEPLAVRAPLLSFWTAAPQMPAACTPPFDWLAAQNVISDEAREQRARKALGAGNTSLARALIAPLPAARAAPLQQGLALLENPQEALGTIAADPRQRFEWPALAAGFQKLARRDPVAAQAVLAQFDRSRIEPGQYGELSRAAALGLAWDRDPGAVAAFQALPGIAVDDSVREWRIRAALWRGDWTLAANWLQTLPPPVAAEPRWTYWRARSAEQLGRKDEAKALYATLSQDNGYYSVLASSRLGARYEPRARALDADQTTQQRLLQSPALMRARELYYVDELRWADREWRAATQNLDAADGIQAALLASHWGWHWQSVPLLTRFDAGDALDLLYPRKAYADEIKHAAKVSDLPAAWIYGVMRQESLFLRQAVSSADALGLLQLKLGTARDAARRAGLPAPAREDLFDVETNLALGSAYLRQMTDRYGGQFVLTVASYNAGPNAVARWLPDAPLAADVWIENVPYTETRKYVERIAWHIAVHDWQTSGKIRDFDQLLQPVRRPAS